VEFQRAKENADPPVGKNRNTAKRIKGIGGGKKVEGKPDGGDEKDNAEHGESKNTDKKIDIKTEHLRKGVNLRHKTPAQIRKTIFKHYAPRGKHKRQTATIIWCTAGP